MNKLTLVVLAVLSNPSFLSYAKMEVVPLVKTEDGHLEIQASINGVDKTAKTVVAEGIELPKKILKKCRSS